MMYVPRDLKGEILLATVLLATALLVDGSGFSEIMTTVAREVLDLGRVQESLVLSAGGLAALLVTIAVAIIVDRRGPHRVMPLGALVAGAGFLLLALASSFWWLIPASVVSGLGMAGVASVILYAVAAKGCYRLRGTVIGALTFLIHLDLGRRVAEPLADASNWQWVAVAFGVLALAGAALLFTALPRVFPVRQHPETLPPWRPTAEDERGLTGRELMRLPGFRKAVGMVTLVFALGFALSSASSIYLVWPLHEDGLSRSGVEGMLASQRLGLAFGALLWGIASDFVRVRLLIPVASLVAAIGVVPLWLLGGPVPEILGVVTVGLVLGATWSLPWVLLADHVGVRFFATVAVVVSLVGNIGGIPGPAMAGLALDRFGDVWVAGVLILLALAFAVAGFMAPRLSFAKIRRVGAEVG